jgi:hypothetical protein
MKRAHNGALVSPTPGESRAFWKGASRVIDLGGVRTRQAHRRLVTRLRSSASPPDWDAVGGDLWMSVPVLASSRQGEVTSARGR